MKLRYIIVLFLFLASCSPNHNKQLPNVKDIDLAELDPSLFSEEEWYIPYYLKHFATVANSVVDTGANRGYFNLSVWRGSRNHFTYNARIMEGILSLVWFYCTDRPWNVYYGDKALKKRIEASLEFWCSIQNEDGRFSEYRVGQWSLAPTAFATKFIGRALWLLEKQGPQIDKEVFEQARSALRKAIFIGFTHEGLWDHGRNYTNQYANLWGGALSYLSVWPDEEIEMLLHKRFRESMTEFQSPVGFFYEKGGPDWGYNLNTHHSDLQVAWEYADENIKDLILKKTRDWYNWFSYNAVIEPDSRCYYLNRAIETRQQKGYYINTEVEDPAMQRWTPQAEFVTEARAFEMSVEEYELSNKKLYLEMLNKYPEVNELEVGEFNAFTPYAFLHHNMKLWHPDENQKEKAIQNLPYLKNDNFLHIRKDSRSNTTYSFIRKPAYYACFNSGKIITKQQRLGLGLIWNPKTGTVFQSQSKTDVAAYGTKAKDSIQVFEARDLMAEFKSDSKKVDLQPGNTNLNSEYLEIQYALGSKGKKQIKFNKDKIQIEVKYPGDFTEILPLLITPNDEIILHPNKIELNNKPGNLVISMSGNQGIQTKNFETELYDKNCKVIEISAHNRLTYEIIFK